MYEELGQGPHLLTHEIRVIGIQLIVQLLGVWFID
jgi:hypothetical protein